MKRHNLVTKVLHGEAGSVDPNSDAIEKGMETAIDACKDYPPPRNLQRRRDRYLLEVVAQAIVPLHVGKREDRERYERRALQGPRVYLHVHFKDRVSST